MKKFATILATTAALASGTAMAEGYVSGAAGTGHVDVDCAGTTSCDNSGTAFKITGGYGFGNGLSAELGYIDFGKAKAKVGTLSAEAAASAVTLGFAYTSNFSTDFSGTARLGVAAVKSKLSGSIPGVGSASDSETKAAAYVGLGLGYAVTKTLKIEAGVDFSRATYADEKANVRAITIGLRTDF